MVMQEEIAQAVANAFFHMEAGYEPTEEWELPVPSSGDLQVAYHIMPLVKRAQAEALREASTWVENLAAHDGLMYRDDGHGDSVTTSIPDALRNRADQIEKEAGA